MRPYPFYIFYSQIRETNTFINLALTLNSLREIRLVAAGGYEIGDFEKGTMQLGFD
jgi:hypothetical protein